MAGVVARLRAGMDAAARSTAEALASARAGTARLRDERDAVLEYAGGLEARLVEAGAAQGASAAEAAAALAALRSTEADVAMAKAAAARVGADLAALRVLYERSVEFGRTTKEAADRAVAELA